jgi:tripeptide aminopeptidase
MSQHLVSTFCDFVRIDSVSGEEDKFMLFLQRLLESDLGAKCQMDTFGNLIAKVPAMASTRMEPVMLAAHGDTVQPGKGIEPIVVDGVIRSAGNTILGADDKAGIAEIYEAVRTSRLHPPLQIVITRSEETGLHGSRNLDLNLVTARIGYVFDSGPLNKIIVGGPTHINLDIDVFGKAAHAADPGAGLSAIRVAAAAIDAMPEGQIDEETTANIGTIKGGMIRNGVPDKVSIQGECRSFEHSKAVAQAEAMRRAFDNAAQRFCTSVDVRMSTAYQAARVPDDALAVQYAKQAIEKAGLDPVTDVMLGGTDALILLTRGIETVVMGYGGHGAHSVDESVSVADMQKATDIIRYLLTTMG